MLLLRCCSVLRWWLPLVAWVALAMPSQARHVVGGQIELLHRTGNTYLLRVNIYVERSNSPGADNLPVSFFEQGTNVRMLDVRVPPVRQADVDFVNPSCALVVESTGLRCYEKTVELSPAVFNSPNGYYAAAQHCCRNAAITNIYDPNITGQTLYLEFPAVVRDGQPFVDSSPTDFPPLANYACIGRPFVFAFGGRDPDGDSLAYELAEPLLNRSDNGLVATPAPYRAVWWQAGFSAQNQVSGNPGLTINARTGTISVTPTALGLFVFGVRCTQYRRGVRIGATLRDFQLRVLNCPPNAAPTLQVRTSDSPAAPAYVAGRDTLRLTPTSPHCVTVRFTDADPDARLTLTVQAAGAAAPGSLPTLTGEASGVVRAPGGPDTLTAQLCFADCADTRGRVQFVDLIVADAPCGEPQRDTVRLAYVATLPPNAAPQLTTTLPPVPADSTAFAVVSVPVGQTYTATLTATDADRDSLSLAAEPAGFDLSALGMRFDGQNGFGRALGTFFWAPTCAAAGRTGLEVTFRLRERHCQQREEVRRVRFEVITTPDTTAYQPPNVITPNGDGLNDYFELPPLPPLVCDVAFAELRIYSRWGREVFRTTNRAFRWGGRGEAALYYYYLTTADGRHRNGWLQVLP